MSRLIDADEMLRRLEEWNTYDAIDKAFYNFCVRRINEQSTAYDVEKVVAELEEASWKSYSDVARRNLLWLDDAIEIVRNGGKE